MLDRRVVDLELRIKEAKNNVKIAKYNLKQPENNTTQKKHASFLKKLEIKKKLVDRLTDKLSKIRKMTKTKKVMKGGGGEVIPMKVPVNTVRTKAARIIATGMLNRNWEKSKKRLENAESEYSFLHNYLPTATDAYYDQRAGLQNFGWIKRLRTPQSVSVNSRTTIDGDDDGNEDVPNNNPNPLSERTWVVPVLFNNKSAMDDEATNLAASALDAADNAKDKAELDANRAHTRLSNHMENVLQDDVLNGVILDRKKNDANIINEAALDVVNLYMLNNIDKQSVVNIIEKAAESWKNAAIEAARMAQAVEDQTNNILYNLRLRYLNEEEGELTEEEEEELTKQDEANNILYNLRLRYLNEEEGELTEEEGELTEEEGELTEEKKKIYANLYNMYSKLKKLETYATSIVELAKFAFNSALFTYISAKKVIVNAEKINTILQSPERHHKNKDALLQRVDTAIATALVGAEEAIEYVGNIIYWAEKYSKVYKNNQQGGGGSQQKRFNKNNGPVPAIVAGVAIALATVGAFLVVVVR